METKEKSLCKSKCLLLILLCFNSLDIFLKFEPAEHEIAFLGTLKKLFVHLYSKRYSCLYSKSLMWIFLIDDGEKS